MKVGGAMPAEGDGIDFEANGETVGTAHPLSFPRPPGQGSFDVQRSRSAHEVRDSWL